MYSTKLRALLTLSVVAVLLCGAACKRNHPPSIPDVTGRLAYRPGDTVRLSATATDQDEDSIAYLFAWVDSAGAVWTENYASGDTAPGTHVYAVGDTYTIRVKAQDQHGAVSDWTSGRVLRIGLFAPGVPEHPAGPDSGVTGDTYRCTTRAASPYGEPVLVEYDWDGEPGETCAAVPSDSLCIGTHVFHLPGTHHVRARSGDTSGLFSAWSDSLAVTVACKDTTPPSVSIISPGDSESVRRGRVVFKAIAADDQIVTRVEFFIDGTLKGTDSVADGDTYSYAWADTTGQIPNQNYAIVAQAWDAGGNQASDTISITISNEFVRWYWQNDKQGALVTSALVANDGQDEVVMSQCSEDYQFYSIKVANGRVKCHTSTQWPEYDFSGGPALCAATGHVIVGSDEGEIYSLSLSGLNRAWRWPNVSPETLEPFVQFGAPAISGNDIYVGRDEDMDSLFRLYKFTDAGGTVTRSAAYAMTDQSVVDAPVVDANGNVYFGTDSGYLYKMDANLTSPIWRIRLVQPVGEVSGPIIGSDGTVYCGTDSGRLFAVSADGSVKWSARLDGVGARPALGKSALFVGSEQGTVYSIDPQTGAINWQDSLDRRFSFYTTPIVAANGYLYIQSDSDVLYCINQADGTVTWVCDCNSYLPGGVRNSGPRRPGTAGLTNYDPNPSITAEGDILVVGQQALFCVAGYEDGPLDPNAAWPKWQRDQFNTGKR